ncbi:hypothetical protein K7Y63_003806 [Serratia marcescens]|uniref:hypothetical protein n=1 Tax=Serratia marcescens TaxID=615 RepID=UPI001F1525DF|nr:hypothetical protein [Serratia marcescens]
MKERPVIFNGEMVRAILDGRKTQTRRIVNRSADIESISTHLDWVHSGAYGKCRPSDKEYANKAESLKSSGLHAFRDANGRLFGLHCPFGYTGDRLWVRETFMDLTGTGIEATTGKFEGFAYRADTPAGSYGDEVRKEYGLKWTPSLHMPRWASRMTLEITAVRVERLNDISQEDAQAEGMELTGWIPSYSNPDNAGFDETFTPYDNFAMLWQSIYGEESWSANPWVWVIEFKRVEVRDASK